MNNHDFSHRALDYDISRPRYDEIAKLILKHINKTYVTTVADFGAGTGLLSEAFINNKLSENVYSIEPCKDMFKSLEKKAQMFKNWKILFSEAEATTLTNNSVDLLCCAQSFHFFNTANTKKEFHRVIKDGGHTALIWNVIDNNDPVVYKFHEVLSKYIGNTNNTSDSPNFIEHENLNEFFEEVSFTEIKYTDYLILSSEKLISLVFSFSYMPKRSDDLAEELIYDLNNFFYKNQINSIVKLKIDYYVYISGKHSSICQK